MGGGGRSRRRKGEIRAGTEGGVGRLETEGGPLLLSRPPHSPLHLLLPHPAPATPTSLDVVAMR